MAEPSTTVTAPAEPPARVPARRRRLFDGPMFWLGLIVLGVALAVALSFLPARGDTASAQPDVDQFCAQVDILGSTDLISLVAGVAPSPIRPVPVTPTTFQTDGDQVPPSTTAPLVPTTPDGAVADQLQAFDDQLVALERVAPHEVRTDVHEVRLAVDDVLTALRQDPSGGIPSTSLLFTVSDAQAQMQQAIERMATYINDTCGIDIRNDSLLSNPFSR